MKIRIFLAAIPALSPYSIYAMYFAGALSYLWLCPMLSAMLYSPPESNPALLFSTSYAEYLSGLSQVKVSNNIILEGIRRGANPPFMLSKKIYRVGGFEL